MEIQTAVAKVEEKKMTGRSSQSDVSSVFPIIQQNFLPSDFFYKYEYFHKTIKN
jgi:hypothetical protein